MISDIDASLEELAIDMLKALESSFDDRKNLLILNRPGFLQIGMA